MNTIKLIGTYDAETNSVKCKRLSENYDVIPIELDEDLIGQDLVDGTRYLFDGSIINDKGNVYVAVHQVDFLKDEDIADSTECIIEGIIKKLYPVRTTRKNRQLQDMLVETGAELLKVVVFEACPEFIKPGLKVHLKGRLQSRSFTQMTTFGPLDKTVYEIALKNLEVLNGEGYQD